MDRHLSRRYGQVILVSGYLVLTAVNWSQHWNAISYSWAPKVVRKCESKHWLSCGADGRSAGGRCTVTWLPNLLGWVDLLSYGAPPTCALRARVELRYKNLYLILKRNVSCYGSPYHLLFDKQICLRLFRLYGWVYSLIRLADLFACDSLQLVNNNCARSLIMS